MSFATHALETVRVSTLYDIRYFFDADWIPFSAGLGRLASLGESTVLLGVITAVCAIGLLLGVLSAGRPKRRIAVLGIALWIAYAAFYAHRGLPPHPHYQFPTWWIAGAALAAAIAFARDRWKPLGAALGGMVFVVAVAQGAFIVSWMSFIRQMGGTRGVHYSTPIGLQTQIVHQACSSGPAVHIVDQTLIWPASLEYLAATERACEGRHITTCGIWSCQPPSSPTAAVGYLQYSAPTGGAVALRLSSSPAEQDRVRTRGN
jgi:hypothetical protein